MRRKSSFTFKPSKEQLDYKWKMRSSTFVSMLSQLGISETGPVD
jgi:hypothetical protein